ncbi:MAG: CHRD domain-containing protein [Candidatus Sumerlaeaceae bacterium]
MNGFKTAALLLLVLGVSPSHALTSLVSPGANWKYLDNGSDQGTAWRNPDFEDSAWASGPAELGYGDGGEITTVGFGSDANNKYTTTYFRRTFFAANANAITSLTLNLVRDDGAVVYLNGTEVYRNNLPVGTIGYNTPALQASAGADESNWYQTSVYTALMREGANLLAVEIHQNAVNSSDISFKLELLADAGAAVTRGPYLNSGTSQTMVIRWRTDSATDSRVRLGSANSALTTETDVAIVTTEHEVEVGGLPPDSKFYYNVSSTTNNSTSNDASPFFHSSPAPGTGKPTRIWATGDFGTGYTGQKDVFDAYRSTVQTTYTNVWLMLGDNAYNTGTDAEYQAKVFEIYPDLFRKTVVWPCLGNHDAGSADSPTQSGVYYNIFTLPKSAQAGGRASGTEAYYSFDFARTHFICLDSEDTVATSGSAMLTWLANDLAATTQDWIIVYFHHPPYTKGSHDSDNVSDSLGKMKAMRENALPVMEAYGVDLCLTGHSHSYERSYLLNGHYGLSTTLQPVMKVDAGSGREDDTGAYEKPVLGTSANNGSVYSVVGSSGQISGGTLNHAAHYVSLNVLGSMIIDIDGDRLDAQFIDDTGAVRDYFTITKGALPVVHSATKRTMTPAQVTVAPTGTTANTSGTVSLNVDANTGALSYDIRWSDLTGTVTGLHLHGATAAEQTTGTTFDLNPAITAATGSASGSITLSTWQVTDLLNGLWYCDLHTAANPSGELRGQLLFDSAAFKTVAFTGNPATDFGSAYRKSSSRANLDYYLTWDETNLYAGIQGPGTYAQTEPTVLYIDTDPQQGSRLSTSGSATPQSYDGRQPQLPFTATAVVYFKTGYAELRKNTAGTWGAANVLTANLNTAVANNIEISIPWSLLPGGIRPARFGYCMMKQNGVAAGTSAYAFLPPTATASDTISNINTSGLAKYITANAIAPTIPAGETVTATYNSGATVGFTNSGTSGGQLSQVRYLSGPSSNSYTGSALSNSGATITPSHVANDRYWTIHYSGSGTSGLNYQLSLDAAQLPGSTDLDRLVNAKRVSGGPWVPHNTTRSGTILSASGFTSFSDFAIAADAAQLPVSLGSFKID